MELMDRDGGDDLSRKISDFGLVGFELEVGGSLVEVEGVP